jgi:serine/threonine protein phosphatase 1
VQIGDYHFVHAGVRPGVPLEAQSPEDMLWIREDFTSARDNFGKMVVHGHTRAKRPVRRQNRIGIDTGAWMTNHLTAAVFEGSDCRFLTT